MLRSYWSEDVIAALSTPLGGPIAIIRVSGPGTHAIIWRCIRSKRESPAAGTLFRAAVRDSRTSSIIDDAMVVLFDEGRSFTGEESAELHIHGNPLIARQVMDLLKLEGVGSALPGEFSFRAVRNGRMTLFQAQGVADLITSATTKGTAYALERLTRSKADGGAVGSFVGSIRALAAAAEVGIDFSDQDVEELSLVSLKRELTRLMPQLAQWKESYQVGVRLQNGVSVVLLGLPNSGKSSLFNAIQGQARAIVSDVPGTTRDVISESFWLQGHDESVLVRWLDTAGLRKDSGIDAVERQGMERTLDEADVADIAIICVAPDLSPADQARLTDEIQRRRAGRATLLVRTKEDLLANQPPGIRQLAVSAQTGEGLQGLKEAILSQALQMMDAGRFEAILTQPRQVAAIQRAQEGFDRALSANELDLFAADLRQGMRHLSEWVGGLAPDDILSHIFSEFCIGK